MRKQDIQIHAAVTIMPNANNLPLVGVKENEIAQFAVQIDARHTPVSDKEVAVAFQGLYHRCLQKMREAGLLRSGS